MCSEDQATVLAQRPRSKDLEALDLQKRGELAEERRIYKLIEVKLE